MNGGTREANCIINVQVSEDTGSDVDDKVHRDARDFLLDETAKAGIPKENVVAIMTAAKMTNVEVITEKFQGLTLTTFVTAGAYFAATPGDEVESKQAAFPPKKWGTINTIMVVDGNLTESCMVNAIVSATEAKAATLRDLDVRSGVVFRTSSNRNRNRQHSNRMHKPWKHSKVCRQRHHHGRTNREIS